MTVEPEAQIPGKNFGGKNPGVPHLVTVGQGTGVPHLGTV